MHRVKEKVSTDLILANCLLANMNEKLKSASSEKKEAVRTVVSEIAYEIFYAFNLTPSPALVKLTGSKKLKSLKLFAAHSDFGGYYSTETIPLPQTRTTPKYLRERIFAACTQRDLLLLLLADIETLLPIPDDLINIVDKFIAEEARLWTIDHWNTDYPKSPQQKKLSLEKSPKKTKPFYINYCDAGHFKEKKCPADKPFNLSQPEKKRYTKYMKIDSFSFFSFERHFPLNQAPLERRLHMDLFARAYEDVLGELIRLLKRNRTIVRFLLVLFDHLGDRLIPLTQQNLLAVCHSVADHEANIQMNSERLERLYYLCSLSRKFSSEVTVWLRRYQDHCVANDTPSTFPELLLTYCQNFPEYVDDRGPLPLKTLCAQVLRDTTTRDRIPYAVAVELVEEESAQPNGVGDDPHVLSLLSHLAAKPSERQNFRLTLQ